MNELYSISPVDGRYAHLTKVLQEITSEYGLIKNRVLIEIRWLQHLSQISEITECPQLSKEDKQYLDQIAEQFTLSEATRIKEIEKETNHDVKAVEYFLQEKIAEHPTLKHYIPFIHFACTSEDINNLSYALMLQMTMTRVIYIQLHQIIQSLEMLGKAYIHVPMLSRTHGQSASPTSVGKELANVVARIRRQLKTLLHHPILGKMNGAVGNFNAHIMAYPDIDWPLISQKFVESLGLTYNAMTTQIEPHDLMADVFHNMMRINTILVDFSRDVWGYISLGYFKQKPVANEVGSSTMPHKINPIDFENAEGNFGIANTLFDHLANKLPISRWQRDLTDSTVLRNLGVAFAHSLIGYRSLLKGISKLDINVKLIVHDLNQHPEVLAEAIQTVMRTHGLANPYEQLKALTRGKPITRDNLTALIDSLALPTAVKKALHQLTPENYIGLAIKLADQEMS